MVMSVWADMVGAMGIGLSSPPSTSTRPRMVTGAKKAGTEMEARMAWNREPRSSHTSFWFSRSVATAV